MAALLYRLGRFCFHRRGRVLAVWLILLAALGGAAAAFHGPTTNAFTMPGTESYRAMQTLDREFPQAGGGTGTIVVASDDGTPLTPRKVAPLVAEAAKVPGVTAAMDPFQFQAVSQDGEYALINVQFEVTAQEVTAEQREAFEAVGENAEGLRVEHGGEVMSSEASEMGSTEVIGVAVAAVVLLITFGSLVAAGMTLANALVGVIAGMAGLFALSGLVELNSTAPVLALMLGLAVGIDYSLFITSRYRQFLAEGAEPREAAGRATGTAGSAVVFAGVTVVIALAGLSVVGIPFLTIMGLAAAGTVALSVLVALTLLPAVLGFAGPRVLHRRTRKGGAAPEKEAFGFRWGRLVTKARVPVLLVGVLALGGLALPVLDMRLALPDASTKAEGTAARDAYDLTSEGFGPGFNGRLIAVLTADDKAALESAAQQAAGLIQGTEGVLAVAPAQFNADGTAALLAVVPKTGPTEAATEDAVQAIRAKVADLQGADIALTGVTAIGIDVSEKLSNALPVYLLLVVGLSLLLLMLVFRSVLVPLKATLGFLLTVGSTFGITVAVFQEGHLASLVGVDTQGPLVSFLPILLIGILFGLAMDYEVFLVSRMREDYVHGDTPRQATVNGLGHNARVVTAAALIMMSVFGGFVLIPDPIIKSIGFALAVGVFIDAFVVRMTLVPAAMSLLGRAAWWLPKPVDKVLPDLDIEGARLPAPEAPAPEVKTPQPVG
ncbi:RND superfamily putative drug exporter [Actinocorallia herbida]|uniref:RND superfamily putative drug exporter n=1 Tax=Actinocorallia herbida TaxID=58109 RepID=A0A3N1D548_9ACTN|nr:MMPL family transporter [Actinocorallia herbida]ROO88654.1 RND superfamily putative drug exporter [Actinocorallia herbida]